MKTLKYGFLTLVFAFFIASPIMAVTTPAVSSVAACEARVLGIPPWYRGLTQGSIPNCTIKDPNAAGGIEMFITKLALNIIEMLMVIVGYVAVFFVIYGGFMFMTQGDSSDGVSKARKTILNALIGLAISLSGTVIINLIFGVLG